MQYPSSCSNNSYISISQDGREVDFRGGAVSHFGIVDLAVGEFKVGT